MPRKATPRQVVSAGSVAIGGNQTGIYPSNSPGGWNIIGKSPVVLFDATKDVPNLLKAGDALKFKSVSMERYLEIDQQVKAGSYNCVTND